ncbi:peptidase S24 [Flavobacterium geliluteum]|uniref:Peptidase S24 n=1 Tax=Flavobacterium geliluteum TaxID=2816120 RepID=A0A941B0B9_9FLAO|nr:peptidase S24 [Flavobacterium geliluteum]MBP4139992.1 peptidase S24 [Flavobacterium geliluteum]
MIQDRILQFIEYKGITRYKFYQVTGLSNGFLDKKGSIGADKCEIIYSYYSEINLEWLITGQGEMLKSPIIKDVVVEDSGTIAMQSQLLAAKDKIIEGLEFKIKTLEKELSEMKYTKSEPIIYTRVAEPAPKLIKKETK